MIELAGELADGIVGWFQSRRVRREVTLPALRRGAERAGRSLDGFDVTVGFPAVVTRDDSGVELAKGQVMMFATALGSTPAYLESARAAGFGADAEAIGELVAAGDLRGAVARVPDEMVDAIVLAGSAERVRATDRALPRGRRHAACTCSPRRPAASTRSTRTTSRSSRSGSCRSSTSRRSSAASTTRSSYWAAERAATSPAA